MEDPTKLDSSGNFYILCIAVFISAGTALTLDPSSFYFPSTVLMAAVTFALAGYAYYISLAGKKVFGDGKFFEAG